MERIAAGKKSDQVGALGARFEKAGPGRDSDKVKP